MASSAVAHVPWAGKQHVPAIASRIVSHYCSSLDSLWPPVQQSWVICFPQGPGTSPQTTARILRQGLERTIMQRPYLAGTVSRDITRERLKLTYPIQGDSPDMHRFLSINDLTYGPARRWPWSYNDLRRQGMPISQLTRQKLEPCGADQAKLAAMPIAAQANFIPGGLLLGVTVHHSLFDGFGAESIVAAWARNCKEVQDHGNHHHPEEDLRVLSLPSILREDTVAGTSQAQLADIDHLWELLGMKKPAISPPTPYLAKLQAVHNSRPSPPTQKTKDIDHEPLIPAIFTATSDSIAHLKAYSTPPPWDLVCGSWPEISTFDAVASLLWRSIMAARLPDIKKQQNPQNLQSRLRIPVSLRKTLKITPSYPGNCLLNAVSSFPLDELVNEPDGERTTPLIRSSIIAARSPTNARAAIQLSQLGDEIVPRLDSGRRSPLFANGSAGPTGADLVLTSWRDLGYYRHDWGGVFSSGSSSGNSIGIGRPEFVRVPTEYLPGVCILLPSRSGSTGLRRSFAGGGGCQDYMYENGSARGQVHGGSEGRHGGAPLDVLVAMPRSQLERLMANREFGEYFSLLAR